MINMAEEAVADNGLPATRGITDRTSGVEVAVEAQKRLIASARGALSTNEDLTMPKMTMLSLFTRAQAFHEAALAMIRENNPFAALTLLRSYAENAAMLVWLLDKPNDIKRIYPEAAESQRIRVGQLVGKAATRLGGFKPIYEQLSNFAHPGEATALSGWHATDVDRHVNWMSAPAFKNDDDFMIACFWLVELAEANGHLWQECWAMYFGDPPTHVPPP